MAYKKYNQFIEIEELMEDSDDNFFSTISEDKMEEFRNK